MTSHTRKWKEKQVEEIKKMLDESKIVAIASLERFPASHLQELKKKLASKAKIKVSKTKVIARALAESKYKDIDFSKYLRGSIAIIVSTMDPFELYATIKKNKASAYAKAGMVAEQDIVVPAGDTGLPPGPDLSILKAAGLPAIMKGSSIQIAKDTVVARKGEVISEEVASALAKLDIKPIQLMLKVLVACDGKYLYDASVLDIDTEKFESDLISCYQKAFNLAFNIGYITPQNIELFIQKAFREAKQLALDANYISPLTLPEFIAKAYNAANSLSSVVKVDAKETEQQQAEESTQNQQEQAEEQSNAKQTNGQQETKDKQAEENKEQGGLEDSNAEAQSK